MTEKLNLEIYSFILNDYSNQPNDISANNFYTTSISSVSEEECGYISDEDETNSYTKKPITKTKTKIIPVALITYF